jgi:hypothetical protein
VNLPNSKNDGNFGVLEFADGMVFSMKAGAKVCSVGIIVSRQNGEDWQRSKCQMTVSEVAIGEQGVSLSRAIYRSTHKETIYIDGANQYLDNAGVSGGQSTDSGSGEAPAAAPVFDNTVSFTANGSTFSNNVSGGSVAVTAPLTKMVVTGQNLTTEMLQISNSGSLSTVGEITKVGENLEVTFADGVGIAGSEFVVRKKTESLTWAEWFTININANAGGGGNGDGGIDND